MPDRSDKRARRRFFRIFLILLVPILLFASFYGLMNWYGHRSWQQYLAQQDPRDALLLKQYHETKIPDDQNFAKTPALQNAYKDSPTPISLGPLPAPFECIGNFQARTWTQLNGPEGTRTPVPLSEQRAAAEKILASYKPVESFFNELHAAAERPYSRFDSSLQWDGPAPNLIFLRSIAQHLTFRGLANLALGDPDSAAHELKVLSQLAGSLKDSPGLILCMIRVALLRLQFQPFYEGWARRQWSQQHYLQFQERYRRIDLLAELDIALRLGEKIKTRNWAERPDRAYIDKIWSSAGDFQIFLLHTAPTGWWKENLKLHHEIIDSIIANTYNLKTGTIYPEKIEQNPVHIWHQVKDAFPFAFLASRAPLTAPRAFQSLARTQSTLDQIILVCALERYFAQHNRYPENLQALVPEFCQSLPNDLISGEPPIYRLNPDRTFTLYSVGWNARDDGGQTSGDSTKDFEEADLVWPFIRLPE